MLRGGDFMVARVGLSMRCWGLPHEERQALSPAVSAGYSDDLQGNDARP
jgi:hypothetical protein